MLPLRTPLSVPCCGTWLVLVERGEENRARVRVDSGDTHPSLRSGASVLTASVLEALAVSHTEVTRVSRASGEELCPGRGSSPVQPTSTETHPLCTLGSPQVFEAPWDVKLLSGPLHQDTLLPSGGVQC